MNLIVARPQERKILLADCDMYFVQVARLEDPERLGSVEHLIVGGQRAERGVVSSASYAARKRGVRSGMPIGKAMELCPHAVVVPVPMGRCKSINQEIATVLRTFTPIVEIASIDEFYLDVTGAPITTQEHDLAEVARIIQKAVLEQTGIQISIGGANQKMAAKMASGLAKPGGVYIVPAGEEAKFIHSHRIEDIPFIGPAFSNELGRRGIVHGTDLLPYSEDALIRWLGESRGRWLFRTLRGIDPRKVETEHEPKTFSRERTFAEDHSSFPFLEGELGHLVQSLGRKLRAHHLAARTVGVYIRTGDFTDHRRNRTVDPPIQSELELREIARILLQELMAQHPVRIRLLGVSAQNLTPTTAERQLSLFEQEGGATNEPHEKSRKLDQLRDQIRDRFGEEVLRRGAELRDAPGP